MLSYIPQELPIELNKLKELITNQVVENETKTGLIKSIESILSEISKGLLERDQMTEINVDRAKLRETIFLLCRNVQNSTNPGLNHQTSKIGSLAKKILTLKDIFPVSAV